MGKVHKSTETKQIATLQIVHWWARSEIECVCSVAVTSDHERRAGILTTVNFLIISTPHYYYCTITTFPFLSKHISFPLKLKLGMYLTDLILPFKPNFKWVGYILVHNQPFTTQKFCPTLSISDTRNAWRLPLPNIARIFLSHISSTLLKIKELGYVGML